MNRVFLDTNVLLDMMIPARPCSNEALEIARMADASEVHAIVCADSLRDIYYVARKYVDEGTLREAIRGFMMLFEVVAIDRKTCEISLDSDEPDFEDGLIRAAAEITRADIILTRDKDAFANCWIPNMEPSSYLATNQQ